MLKSLLITQADRKCAPTAFERDGGILVQMLACLVLGGYWGCVLLPATFFAVLEEGAVAVHFQIPAALYAAAVAPVDVGHDVRVGWIPLLRGGE
jgi:hypothetical protein